MPPTIANDRKRERKKAQMPPPGLAFTPQMVLSASCSCPKTSLAPKRAEKDPNDRGQQALIRLGRLLRDVLHDLDCTLIEKIAHLLGDFVPCAAWIIAKDQTDYREQHEDERCERKHSVIGESST